MRAQIKKHLALAAIFAFLLFLASFLLYFNFSYMGVRDRQVERIVMQRYGLLVVFYNLKILLFYFVFAVIVAGFSLLLRIEKIWNVFLFQVYVWFFFWLRAVKLFPQLYDDQLLHRGGVLKFFQMALTDYVPFFLLYLLFLAILWLIAWRKKSWLAGGVITVLCLLFVWKFSVRPLQPRAATKPNLLILAMDSLRPSRISYNGYWRKTPNIDSLFAHGANFLNAKSSLARTFSSFTSIFTSTYPLDHTIRYMFPTRKQLDKRWVNLVAVLNRQGYETSVVTDFAGDIFAQVQFGFQNIISSHTTIQNLLKQRSIEIHYFLQAFLINPAGRRFFPEMWLMPLNIDAYFVMNGAKHYIRQAAGDGKPFFILAFCSNNHFPYVSKYPYYRLYTPRGYDRQHKYRKMDNLKLYSGFHLPAADERQVNGLYDGAVKMFDDEVGGMMDFLRRSNLDKNTIVVIISDHGESLYDDDLGTGHGDHLRGPFSNSLTFGISSPFESFAGRRIEKTVRDIDIAPTLLDLLKIPIPGEFRGFSLAPQLRGQPFAGYPAYMETELWFTANTPYIHDRPRIPYPELKYMIDIDRQTGEIFLKPQFHQIVIQSRHRALQLNEKKYIYMPGDNGTFQEEWYLNEKLVGKGVLNDPAYLELKQKMIETFPGKLILEPSGRIMEIIPKIEN